MTLDWIHNSLESGKADVYCKECDFDSQNKTYKCHCWLGATVAALTFGLEGYRVGY